MLCYPTYKLEKSPGPGTTGKNTFQVISAILMILLIVWDATSFSLQNVACNSKLMLSKQMHKENKTMIRVQ